MDITRLDDGLLRFVDDEAKAIIREGIALCVETGPLSPPYRGATQAKAARVIKGLLQVVSELAERLEMTDSYVESATAARQELPEIPGLAFEEPLPLSTSYGQMLLDQLPHVPGLPDCGCMLCRLPGPGAQR